MNKPPIEGMIVIPEGLPLMASAWIGLVRWAAGEEGLRQEFMRNTGLKIESLLKRSPIDRMIDESTGYARMVVAAWCDWVTVNLWGQEGQESSERKAREPFPVDERQLTLW